MSETTQLTSNNTEFESQIREQMSGTDLHVFILKFLALKQLGFLPIKNAFQNLFDFFYLYSVDLFSGDPKIFSKAF